MVVCSEIHTKHVNTVCGQLMLYREIMAVCSEIHTKHINTVCGAERRIIYIYIHRLSPYRAVNTLRLCYKNQSVNAV